MEEPTNKTIKLINLPETIAFHWHSKVRVSLYPEKFLCLMECNTDVLVEVCNWLFSELGYRFASLVVEDQPQKWLLRYLEFPEFLVELKT
jgi:hypothetical protein